MSRIALIGAGGALGSRIVNGLPGSRAGVRRVALVLASLGLAGSLWATSVSAAPTVSRDLAREEVNRQQVIDFYERFFNRHEVEQAAAVVADDYRQHNPDVADGKAPFVTFFKDYFKANPQSRARIVRSAVDGDLVWLHVHATNGAQDRGQAVVDVFRVKDGKLVEHWDVIQDVPLPSANANGMF